MGFTQRSLEIQLGVLSEIHLDAPAEIVPVVASEVPKGIFFFFISESAFWDFLKSFF